MERDTHGLEAALPAPTLIHEDRMQPGKCYDSFSSTRSHSKKDKHNASTDKPLFYPKLTGKVGDRTDAKSPGANIDISHHHPSRVANETSSIRSRIFTA
jgi:hypothetical protein